MESRFSREWVHLDIYAMLVFVGRYIHVLSCLPYPTEAAATRDDNIETRSVGWNVTDEQVGPEYLSHVSRGGGSPFRRETRGENLGSLCPGRPMSHLEVKLNFVYRVRPTAPHGCHVVDQRVPGKGSAGTLIDVRPAVSHTTTNHMSEGCLSRYVQP